MPPSALFDGDDQILAHAPERLRIGDAESVLTLGILFERIGTGGMVCHQFGTLGIEADGLRHSKVDAGEIVLVEIIALEDIATLKDALFAKFLLGAEHIVGRVELLVLSGNGAGLGLILLAEAAHVGIERSNLLALLGNLDVALGEFFAERFDFLVLIFQLFGEIGHHFFQLRLGARIALRSGTELLLEIGDEFSIELKGALDEGHVFHNGLLVGAFTLTVFNCHAAFSLIDLIETVLNLRERFNQVARLVLRLREGLTQRIDSGRIVVLSLFFFFFRVAAHRQGEDCCQHKKNLFHCLEDFVGMVVLVLWIGALNVSLFGCVGY